MTERTKLFTVLWLAGMIGVLSILFIDLNAITHILPIPPGEEVPKITPAIKGLGLIQPAILLAVAVFTGAFLAEKVGLHAPAAEAAVSGQDFSNPLVRQLLPGILGGIAGGVAIVLISRIALPFLPAGASQSISTFVGVMPLVTRLGYGGITEELLLRWGFMTLVAWTLWRLFQRDGAMPGPLVFVAAILISSLLFGVGHLPIAYMLFAEPTAPLLIFVISANSAFGLIAGLLFWKKGLESAIFAHMTTHLVLFGAGLLGAYF